MKRLWMIIFPLLFLPNLGLAEKTRFGMLEMSDWLILPLIIALLLAPASRSSLQISRVKLLFLLFLGWSLLSVLTIYFRYEYRDDITIIVLCLLKTAKLAAYAVAGVLIPARLVDAGTRRAWLWSLLGAMLAISLGLLTASPFGGDDLFNREAYKSYNVVIVLMSILCCYVASIWFDNRGSTAWRVCAGIGLVLVVLSIVLSASKSTHGRGGWLALAVGLGYLLVKRSRHLKAVALLLLLIAVATTGYLTMPGFKHLVDSTISPPSEDVAFAVDDGARFKTWAHEGPKWVNAPVFGTGLYHRGGRSGLWSTGSHNFFLQVLLEAGLVGAGIMLMIFWRMWRNAGSTLARHERLTTAARASLLAGVVAGMSGEYFYSGAVVLVLLATNAGVASLPIETAARRIRVAERVRPAVAGVQ